MRRKSFLISWLSYLKELLNEHRWQVGCILINVSKDATWRADAFNYLQEVTASFALNYPAPFVEILKTYDVREQDDVIAFLADGIHSPAEGYAEIVEQLRNLHEESLVKRFVEIEKQRALTRGHD